MAYRGWEELRPANGTAAAGAPAGTAAGAACGAAWGWGWAGCCCRLMSSWWKALSWFCCCCCCCPAAALLGSPAALPIGGGSPEGPPPAMDWGPRPGCCCSTCSCSRRGLSVAGESESEEGAALPTEGCVGCLCPPSSCCSVCKEEGAAAEEGVAWAAGADDMAAGQVQHTSVRIGPWLLGKHSIGMHAQTSISALSRVLN